MPLDLTAQPYTAHLRVGAHSWDVDSTDDPAFGPLAGLRFAWAARQDDGWPTQHDPTLLVFGVVVEAGVDFDDVDQGTWVHFTFTPSGYATPLVEFGGTVRDLTASPHDRGMVYAITAIDPLRALVEDYTVSAFLASGAPVSTLWPMLVADAGGAGLGLGIRPALVDPFTGIAAPNPTGFSAADLTIAGNAWDVLTGYLSAFLVRVGQVPLYQRAILTYRLDVAGNLAAQPYAATWTTQGAANAPLSLVDGPDGWTDGEGNVDACLLRTDATVWERQRIEPNTVIVAADLGPFTYDRPHTGPDVVRDMTEDWPAREYTDPNWVVAGLDSDDQWGTEFALLGVYDPAVVGGWFTLPTAMRLAVAAHGIDPRHTPTGSGRVAGMLAGASLIIPAGGRWEVRFRLRRTLPDPDAVGIGGWPTPAAITYDDLTATHPALTYNDLDPALTYNDALMIGE